jgi:hypothetical protein
VSDGDLRDGMPVSELLARAPELEAPVQLLRQAPPPLTTWGFKTAALGHRASPPRRTHAV